jgi:ketosteroid isomerase-like protein
MSTQNVETLRRAYGALGRGDVEGILELCDSQIECQLPEGGINAGTLRGRKSLRTLLEGYLDAFDEYRAEPERYLEAGDRVVVFLRISGRGRGSDLHFEQRPAHLWTIREGKAVRLEVFPRGAGALEAAGLSD